LRSILCIRGSGAYYFCIWGPCTYYVLYSGAWCLFFHMSGGLAHIIFHSWVFCVHYFVYSVGLRALLRIFGGLAPTISYIRRPCAHYQYSGALRPLFLMSGCLAPAISYIQGPPGQQIIKSRQNVRQGVLAQAERTSESQNHNVYIKIRLGALVQATCIPEPHNDIHVFHNPRRGVLAQAKNTTLGALSCRRLALRSHKSL